MAWEGQHHAPGLVGGAPDLWSRQHEANWPVWAALALLLAGAAMIWNPSLFSATAQLFATAGVLFVANLFGREAKRRCRRGAPRRVLASAIEGASFLFAAIWFSYGVAYLFQSFAAD